MTSGYDKAKRRDGWALPSPTFICDDNNDNT
eukprot:CAMPEP_0194573964 /NCGR_PEP_ID=MMETSP0292-20121207/9998_1 /TAXON_ID=39354 /ORGANISM="Heterosigma akashiwo, Strain CCMP2393" /LENGTH=30 /DNA_ID= /DNA_START= /DNA_END= /DNA_ORIENTATION=